MLLKKSNNNIVEEEETLNLNTVMRVLSKRIGTSKTFGENIIFMLNRSGNQSTNQSINDLVD